MTPVSIVEGFLFDFFRENKVRCAIQFSEYTNKWYIESPIEIKDGHILKSICEHRCTAEEARVAFIRAVSGETIVFNSIYGDRVQINVPRFF